MWTTYFIVPPENVLKDELWIVINDSFLVTGFTSLYQSHKNMIKCHYCPIKFCQIRLKKLDWNLLSVNLTSELFHWIKGQNLTSQVKDGSSLDHFLLNNSGQFWFNFLAKFMCYKMEKNWLQAYCYIIHLISCRSRNLFWRWKKCEICVPRWPWTF